MHVRRVRVGVAAALGASLLLGCVAKPPNAEVGADPGVGAEPSVSETASSAPAEITAASGAPPATQPKLPHYAPGSFADQISAAYAAALKQQPELSADEVYGAAHISEAQDATALGFNVRKTRYYEAVKSGLQLTPAEDALFVKQGVVGVDHLQHYSMGSAYYAIYTRDLPVLVTTDSILHAWHRSYAEMLRTLEAHMLRTLLSEVLDATHNRLGILAKGVDPRLNEAWQDVDLYLSVARSLLAGAGDNAAPDDNRIVSSSIPEQAQRRKQEHQGQELLKLIAAGELQHPNSVSETLLYGESRHVDYSQFSPRGHYTESAELQTYFRTLMWLGRPDLGFTLSAGSTQRPLNQPQRQLRAAALFSLSLKQAGKSEALAALNRVINLFVGASDDISVEKMSAGLSHAGLEQPAQILEEPRMDRLQQWLAADPSNAQQIRSQPIVGAPEGDARPPMVFQVFGQRFALDSFALSKVVYDSITYHGEVVGRQMPSGLDVMAALDSATALRLLKPELQHWQYGANLLALRQTVKGLSFDQWNSDLYQGWLGALHALTAPQMSSSQLANSSPPRGKDQPRVPQVMRGAAWQSKLLQTQLGSWAELRHDTLGYAKQSYTAGTSCEYPAGYVEPYPMFFVQMQQLAKTGSLRLAVLAQELRRQAGPGITLPGEASNSPWPYLATNADSMSGFLSNFAHEMGALQALAEKELAGTPFSQADIDYLRQTIDVRMRGSGGPTYSGWYPGLIYGTDPRLWSPTVADVHTAVDKFEALEVATGNVNFIAVAIDNGPHRAVYVGPIYSYYEFAQSVSQRLTDDTWAQRLDSGPPPRPTWAERLFPATADQPKTPRTLPPIETTVVDGLLNQLRPGPALNPNSKPKP